MCSWDTRQMFFGAGTRLFVEPRSQAPAKPSVFIMKNETKVACLVKDFYPKTININFKSSKKIEQLGSAVVISPSGKYSAVKLGQGEDSNSVTCSVEHNNEIVHSTDFESKTDSSESVKPTAKPTEPAKPTKPAKPTEPAVIKQTTVIQHHSYNHQKPKATVHMETVNMMSLTVLGLRILFAKSVAINFLLTVKLFFF